MEMFCNNQYSNIAFVALCVVERLNLQYFMISEESDLNLKEAK